MSKINNIGTYTLTSTGGPAGNGVYTIVAADGVYILAMKLKAASTANYQGAATIGDFGGSTAIDLVEDEPTVISSDDPIDNYTITVLTGEVVIITNQ